MRLIETQPAILSDFDELGKKPANKICRLLVDMASTELS
jgi:hypothetical protein